MLNKIKKFIDLSLSRKIQFITNIYHKIKAQIFYKFLFKDFGKGSVIKKPLFLTPEFITIGNNVFIWDHARIEGIETEQNTLPLISIEDNVRIGQRVHITCGSDLVIGNGTVIAFDVRITDLDHEYREIGIPINKQALIQRKTKIGKNCFIGAGAKIQAGTILGNQCIVGSNAVVTGTFPDYSVIAGVPAKIIRLYNNETENWDKIKDSVILPKINTQ